MPGIPESVLKEEAAGQAGSTAPQPRCLPATLTTDGGREDEGGVGREIRGPCMWPCCLQRESLEHVLC